MFSGIDQVLIGGESGRSARPMQLAWPWTSRDKASAASAAVWFKQFGTWPNNPLYRESNAPTHLERVRQAVARGERLARIEIVKGKPKIIGEKGGAALDGEVLHGLPPAFHHLARQLDAGLL